MSPPKDTVETAKEILAKISLGLGANKILLIELSQYFPDLHHYLDDEDIRQKDEWYRKMQEACLLKFLNLVASGENNQAQKISFLSECE